LHNYLFTASGAGDLDLDSWHIGTCPRLRLENSAKYAGAVVDFANAADVRVSLPRICLEPSSLLHEWPFSKTHDHVRVALHTSAALRRVRRLRLRRRTWAKLILERFHGKVEAPAVLGCLMPVLVRLYRVAQVFCHVWIGVRPCQ